MLVGCCRHAAPGASCDRIQPALDGWGRWLAPALIAGRGADSRVAAVVAWTSATCGGGCGGRRGGSGRGLREGVRRPFADRAASVGPDFSILGSALGLSLDPTALTTSEGSLLIVNAAYRERFGGNPRRSRWPPTTRRARVSSSRRPWRGAMAPVASPASRPSAGSTPGRGRARRRARRASAVALSAARRRPIR